ncbi:MAG: glycosyltransferase family 2 protein [candidate division KSB1 bacterium]|nr:glycosyltransferase family 2 protein [candidate division KSB1 bacterium]MDZ7274364.1 glycosyltransferase family 2 protein [candidate division KSB1 bacterium]MDZ7284974.1 glycosyltransferase family 2 protein [candidate division KSB1 bacterium]MDZ7297605.1 glycosyltransferase family 2 protein [candidate division KSB1 bacterium]MDZ7306345.1 glycosyltransferase family 2 protein [candidate division KSB1 bacterium]
MLPTVSIIIVSYNTKAILLQCLHSLREHVQQTSFETVVVDNASHDGTAEAVAADFPEVILIRNNENRGFACANNQGIARARGEYLLFLNPDTVFVEDAITPVLAYMEAHSRVGIGGCKILSSDRELQPSFFPLPNLLTMSWTAFFLDRLLPLNCLNGRWVIGRRHPTAPTRVQRLLGAYLFVRRRALVEVGGFDETFFLFCEEEDFCHRMVLHNWEIHYLPVCSIVHLGGQSTTQENVAAIVHANAGKVHYFRKHHERATQILFRAIWFLALVLRLMLALRLPASQRRHMIRAYCQSLPLLFQPLKPEAEGTC